MNDKHREICENLGWKIIECSDGDYELEKWSPAGEDIIFDVSAKKFVESVREYADSFDVDDHVEMWISGRGQRGVPSTVRELLEDAEAIEKMLDELADALEEAEEDE